MKGIFKALLLGAILVLLLTDFATHSQKSVSHAQESGLDSQESELDPQESELDSQESELDSQEPKPLLHTFYYPVYQAYRLDWCLVWSNYCGSNAAHVFCLSKGFSTVYDYLFDDNSGPTKLIGTNQICNYPQCGSFTYITCQ